MNGLHYTLAGEQRKQMAQVISEIIQEKVVYKRVPTCAYQIGFFTISKDGVLSWTEDTDAETVKGVVAGLQMMGFTAKTELALQSRPIPQNRLHQMMPWKKKSRIPIN